MDQIGTYVRILRESLERKRRYLEEILALTNKQAELAAEEKFREDAFTELVDQKEILIGNINEGDKGFSSVYDRVRQEIQADPMRYREELQAIQNLIRQCVDLGMQIEAVEEPCGDGTGLCHEVSGRASGQAVEDGCEQVL